MVKQLIHQKSVNDQLKVPFRSPQNPEEESPASSPNTSLPLQTTGGVTYSTDCLGMSICTACSPPGLRLTPLRTLRRSHQQVTPCRPEEESPPLLPAWG